MAGQQYHGRLELTWTNKDLRLLAHDDGTYEWLPASDFRVAEVRLLRGVAAVGEVANNDGRAADNLLIHGDALNALTSLATLPEFEAQYAGKVKLAYLDPPFNTQQSFLQYDDALEHSVWLTMMRDRLAQIKVLLSPDGSVWVHCDDSEQAYLKVVMDELFGRENFVASIVWQKLTGRDNRTDIATTHDYILVYATVHARWSETRNLLAFGAEQEARYSNPDNDPRGPWTSSDLTAKAGPGRRQAQFYDITLPSGRVVSPPSGRCWLLTRERLDEFIAENRIWFRDGDSVPRLKRFLSEVAGGLVPSTWWSADEVATNDAAKKEIKALLPELVPFDTPKPEKLIARIIAIASNPGDIVLDSFLGSGTTAAVAHKMGRRWIGIERSAETVETYSIPRLKKVVEGADPGGITKEVGWKGGGGFRVLDVARSMFNEFGGQVYLAEWAISTELAEATAAQLHYDFALDPPFCGRRGRSRLAVIDGLVNDAVVQLVERALRADEQLVLCGTAVDPPAGTTLRELRPGSTVRKIPQSILQEYRRAVRWVQPELFGERVSEPEVAEA